MKGILLITLLTISNSLFASTITVKGSGISYKLTSTEKSIWLRSFETDLNINKSICNEDLFNNYQAMLNLMLKRKVINQQDPNKILLSIDKREYHIDSNSKLAVYLFDLPKRITKLKLAERSQCE